MRTGAEGWGMPDKKDERFHIRIAQREKDLVEAAAARSGRTTSRWARAVLIDVARRTIDQEEPDERE